MEKNWDEETLNHYVLDLLDCPTHSPRSLQGIQEFVTEYSGFERCTYTDIKDSVRVLVKGGKVEVKNKKRRRGEIKYYGIKNGFDIW